MDMSINIRKAANGIIVRYDDPEISKKNEAKGEDDKFEDPEVTLVFESTEKAMPEVQRVLKLMNAEVDPKGEFDSAFSEAAND